MKIFVFKYSGVYLSGLVMVIAGDEDSARALLDTYDVYDKITEVDIDTAQDGTIIDLWDGDY